MPFVPTVPSHGPSPQANPSGKTGLGRDPVFPSNYFSLSSQYTRLLNHNEKIGELRVEFSSVFTMHEAWAQSPASPSQSLNQNSKPFVSKERKLTEWQHTPVVPGLRGRGRETVSFKLILLLSYEYACFVCTCLCSTWHIVPGEAQRGHRLPGN